MEDTVTFYSVSGGTPLAHFARVVGKLNPTPADLVAPGKYLVAKTRSQALSGFDVKGNAFAPYSPRYQKQKHQEHVDLYGRNSPRHMLDAVQAVVTTSPLVLAVGIIDDAEMALRARVNDGGLTITGRKARSFIKKLTKITHQKRSGLTRRLRNAGSVQVIPARHFLEVTPQDVRIMGEMVADSIVGRLNS